MGTAAVCGCSLGRSAARAALALILLKRRVKKRTEQVPDDMPTLAQAVRWIADLGGYTGKSSGGPPGTITIGRGLQRICDAAELLEQMERQRTPR